MRGRKRMVTGVAVFLVLGLNLAAVGEDVYEAWVARYDGAGVTDDRPIDLVTDDSGNVYVTGTSVELNYLDYLTIKYTADGDTLWVRRYNGTGNGDDIPCGIVLDKVGNVYVSGTSVGIGTGSDYATIKYSPIGEIIWIRRYNGPYNNLDRADDVGIDSAGYVYITGINQSPTNGTAYQTLKYSPTGTLMWTLHSHVNDTPGFGGKDFATSLNVTPAGEVFTAVSGLQGVVNMPMPWPLPDLPVPYYGTTVSKYNTNSSGLWSRAIMAGSYDKRVVDIFVNSGGEAFVTSDYGILKISAGGSLIWSATGVKGNVIAVDSTQHLYVTGGKGTFAYSADSGLIWGMAEHGTDLAISDDAKLHLCGGTYNFQVFKLNQAGETLWVKEYRGFGYGDNGATALTVDWSGNLYVTGYSLGSGPEYDFVTIKYSPCLSSSPKAGDANSDDSLSLADIVSMVNHIFGKNVYPPCDYNLYDCWVFNRFCRYDWNGDQKITLGDCVRAINYIFNKPGGPWNPVPSLGCCPFQ